MVEQIRERERLNLRLDKGTVASWRAIATRLGYVVDRGAYTGQGSIAGLMQAVGRGDLVVIRAQGRLEDMGEESNEG